MKKAFSAIALGLMMICMLGAVSAAASTTAIAGKIYNADFTQTISGATVIVSCDNVNQTTTSLDDGAYSVKYSGATCNNGDSLVVYASKVNVGANRVEGEIHDNIVEGLDFNLGVVNVPLVPEFGLIAGITTVLGALGLFFVVRRK
jgi:hypothetical protein